MIVYYHGSPEKLPTAEHTVIVCPAGHKPKDYDGDDWWNDEGDKRRPREFPVLFRHGQSEVDDNLGQYMIRTGLAMKSKLVVPNSWGH